MYWLIVGHTLLRVGPGRYVAHVTRRADAGTALHLWQWMVLFFLIDVTQLPHLKFHKLTVCDTACVPIDPHLSYYYYS